MFFFQSYYPSEFLEQSDVQIRFQNVHVRTVGIKPIIRLGSINNTDNQFVDVLGERH